VYWLIGCSTDFIQFLKFSNIYYNVVVVLCTVAIVGNSIGFWTGSLFKDAQRSSAMAPALLLPLMMFSGLYNRLDSIPNWISWMQYISPFRYGLHAVMLNEYNDEKYYFYGVEFDYKDNLSINLSYWGNVGVLLGLSGLYYLLAFIFLKNFHLK
jgi:ABC-type multidrug transport system permease subunit